MPDEDLLLGEVDHSEADEFPPPERRIITQPQDLSVATLVDQWSEGLLFLPAIQREYVWDNGKASRLIESLLLNIPIPVLYFQETPDARFEVIDGHQRVKSLVRYFNNEFPLSGLRLLNEYKGARYHKLPDREQRFLRTRTLRAVIISQESHPSMKIEVFGRLNTGGIALNAQEVRHALYQGALNDLLKDLELNQHFRECIGWRRPRKRMVDRELILRFFALRERLSSYRPSLLRFLNKYMEETTDMPSASISRAQAIFETTIDRIHLVLGDSAFRVIDEDGARLEKNINRALFDAEMLTFSWIRGSEIPESAEVIGRIGGLLRDEEFNDSIRLATGDRSRTLTRIRKMAKALTEAGLDLDVPSMSE